MAIPTGTTTVVCEHGGTCQNLNGTYRCNCPIGFTGRRCERNINECDSDPCQNDGTCLDERGGYRCICMPGREGVFVHVAAGRSMFVCLFVGCLTSQQHASVSQGRICSDNFTCCHTEIEAADQTFYLTQSQYTGPTSPSADPITPGAWQGSH